MAIKFFSTKAAADAVGGETSWCLVSDGKPWRAATGADMTPVPEVVVQLLQLKIALHNAGLLVAAQTAVNGASQQRQLQWQIQPTIRRGELVSNLLRTALSQTPAQWDAIFAAAAAIDTTS